MRLARDLKRMLDQIPDNVPVSIGESYDVNTMYVANVHFFPTREALCEHYRKIFE